MELRHAGKEEVQDVQSADNANISATYSKLQLSVIIGVQKTLDNIVLGLCCPAAFCSPDFFLLHDNKPFLKAASVCQLLTKIKCYNPLLQPPPTRHLLSSYLTRHFLF